jgi:hypothetical protein
MRKNFDKIMELIKRSDLSPEDKIDLTSIFSLSKNDVDLEPIANLFSEDPTWIEKINDNYKGKSAAIAAHSSVAWDKIIEDEERQLKQFEV